MDPSTEILIFDQVSDARYIITISGIPTKIQRDPHLAWDEGLINVTEMYTFQLLISTKTSSRVSLRGHLRG